MIPEIRSGVLSADVGYSEDNEQREEKGLKEVQITLLFSLPQRLVLNPFNPLSAGC